MEILYPIGYGTQLVTMNTLRNMFMPHMHPEAWRRGEAFLESHVGKFGVGGGYRPPGTQPNQPGYAPPGKSFHEGQQFPSGLYYCAWDTVVVNPGSRHRSPTWVEVPAQGSKASISMGVHMNVSGEPWHMQPIELDGWDSWANAGKPDIRINYPIGGVIPIPAPIPPINQEDEVMYLATLSDGSVVVVGSSIRPVSSDEIGPNGPYAKLPRFTPEPQSNWHVWLRAGLDEYISRMKV